MNVQIDGYNGRRVFRALAALLALTALTNPREGHGQFAVSPVIVQMPASVESTVALLRIDNEGVVPMHFRVYALDFDQDLKGNHVFAEPRTSRRSCADRLDVAPGALTVPAGKQGLVQVRLRPAPGESTCWSMVFVEAPASAANGVRVNQRIGVKLYGLSADAGPEGVLTGAEAAGLDDSVDVRFRFSNPGDWPVRPEGTVEIRDLTGSVVAMVPIPAFSVLPARERLVEVSIPARELNGGRYLAVPILDFGADFLAGAQVDFRLAD